MKAGWTNTLEGAGWHTAGTTQDRTSLTLLLPMQIIYPPWSLVLSSVSWRFHSGLGCATINKRENTWLYKASSIFHSTSKPIGRRFRVSMVVLPQKNTQGHAPWTLLFLGYSLYGYGPNGHQQSCSALIYALSGSIMNQGQFLFIPSLCHKAHLPPRQIKGSYKL